ncbi:hypothetical protein [Streptomyces sp. NBC_01803]|nr:hypothetical protein [Streptomyces sp. NBC_01803]WSA43829.1 hypothetical protein OIE51_06195 [Streptomyces sp. NBC_01803]
MARITAALAPGRIALLARRRARPAPGISPVETAPLTPARPAGR